MEIIINKLSEINKVKNLLDAGIRYVIYLTSIGVVIFKEFKLEKLKISESIIIILLLSLVFWFYCFLMIKKYKEDNNEIIAKELYEKMNDLILNDEISKLEKLLLMHKENQHIQITTVSTTNQLQQNVTTITIKYDVCEEKLIYIN